MNIHASKRLFLVAAVIGVLAVFVAGFFVALAVRSVVAGPGASPDGPNPGHPWEQIELPPGTWPGLDADTVDGLQASELGGGGYWTQAAGDLYPNSTAWWVGIGTTDAQTKLDIAGLSVPQKGQLRIKDTGGDDPFISFYDSASTFKAYVGYVDGLTQFGSADGSNVAITNPTLGGNVGIGTQNPYHKLDVVGDRIRLRKDQEVDAPEIMLRTDGMAVDLQANNADLYIRSDPGDTFIQPYAGNVGIGTSSPSDETKVHVQTDVDDNFGVLVDASGTAGSEIGLHTAASKFASLAKNAYFDGVWERFDTTAGAFLQQISPSGSVDFFVAESGANPISWLKALTLETNGNTSVRVLEITGGSDIAEPFDIREADAIKPGMVLTIDPENAGKLRISEKAYDRLVAGVVSGAGGIEPGLVMGQSASVADGAYPVALTGRVYVWTEASNGPIEPGDLLTTSDTPGHAMKVADYERAQGAVIGKAMSSLEEGQGLVLVLVSLQ